MSGSRLTRKVTVEGSKKISDTTAPRKSVFDRLGPGGLERSQSRRDEYSEPMVEKCRHWLKDGRCPFGSKCRYDHGSTSETKSKLKIIRSIVSKSDELGGEKKSVVRVKRFQSPEEEPLESSPKKSSTKRIKPDSVKVTKESLREESKMFKEHRREQAESKSAEKRKEIGVRRSTSSSGWNLHDNSDTDEGNDSKQLDWEVRGAIHQAREVALEERRNDLRRQIAKIDQHAEPVVTISNIQPGEDSSPPYQEEDAKPEKKKKSKSDKSKKKMKKKSHKSDSHRMLSEGFAVEGDYGEKVEKPKKTKSSSGKKKKKHDSRNDSDREMMHADIPYRKQEFESEFYQRDQRDYHEAKKKSDGFQPQAPLELVGKSRHGDEPRRDKNPDLSHFEPEASTHHFDRRNRSPNIQSEVRPLPFDREHRPAQYERESRGPQYEREPRQSRVERESRQSQMDKESRQLEREARQFEREVRQFERESHKAQLEEESRQYERETHQAHLERESRKAQFDREPRPHTEREPRQYEKASRQHQFERETRPPPFEREPRQATFERESRQAQFERESRQPVYEKETRPTQSEKESRSSHNEKGQRSPPFDRRNSSPPFEKDTRPVQPEWEVRLSHLESRSPVMKERHRQTHVDQPRSEEQIARTDHQSREEQKTSKTAVSERAPESLKREEKVKKKSTPQHSPSRKKPQLVEQKESVKEERKTNSKPWDDAPKEVKMKAKKTEKPKEAVASPVLRDQEQSRSQKSKPAREERMGKGPRTPSPEIKPSAAASRNPEPVSAPDTTAGMSQKREKKVSGQKSSQTAGPKEVKLSKQEKPVPQQTANESISGSSYSGSSSSSDESVSEAVESVSGEERKVGSSRTQHVQREAKKKKEPVAKESKREQREDKKAGVSRDHPEHTERSAEPTKERSNDEPRERNVPQEKDRHVEDRKERALDYDRREDREEKYCREHARDHRRAHDEEPERRLDSRGSKDVRERDSRDHRDSRDYRDFPRVDYRDPRERERFREFDERDRHHPFDIRREYREGPPEFARGGWGRDIRGRDGYDMYDSRGPEYDARRDVRVIPPEFDRHYERDRPHPERGGRFREMEERHDGAWYERRGERGYRESDRERDRYGHEGRERFQDDGKASRGKRSRGSPEASRGERRGRRKERKRGSGTPEESEEWDYEEGHSPAPEAKDQQTSSRKRPKESASPSRSPRSDSVKRKKVATPESSNQDVAAKTAEAVEKKETPSKEDEKDNKKSKKEKGKKTKKRKLSEDETGSTEAVGTPERKRTREVEQSAKDKEVKKSKGQTETAKKPSSDVEGDTKARKTEVANTKTPEPVPTEDTKPEKKSGEQVFSDWSDASEGVAVNKQDSAAKTEEKQEKNDVEVNDEEEKAGEPDGSFEDVYDPISDDELEAIIADEAEESKVKEKTQTLDIEDVDWSILGSSTAEKVSQPGDYIKRFSAGNVFSRIGISSALAGPALTKTVQEKCSQNAPDKEMKNLLLASDQKKLKIGALVAAEARKLKERANVVNDIGPCRRALCARRDFHIRKQLRRLTTTKLGSKLLLDNTAVEPVDSELFAMSVSIFRRGMTDVKDEPRTKSPTLPDTSQVLVC